MTITEAVEDFKRNHHNPIVADLRQEIDRLDHEADLNCQETAALSHEIAALKAMNRKLWESLTPEKRHEMNLTEEGRQSAALCAAGKLEAELRVDNELELSRQRVMIADLKDKLTDTNEIIEMACAHNGGYTRDLMPDKSIFERLISGYDELVCERQRLNHDNFELRAKLSEIEKVKT